MELEVGIELGGEENEIGWWGMKIGWGEKWRWMVRKMKLGDEESEWEMRNMNGW